MTSAASKPVSSTLLPLSGVSLIAGGATVGGQGKSFTAINAATGELLQPSYRAATTEDVDHAVRRASEAFDTYRETSSSERAAFLRAIATRIESMVDALVERVGLETGLPEPRVRGETARTVSQLRMFASIAEEGSWVDARIEPPLPDRQPLPRPDIRSMLRPLGPVAVFGASNFPLAFSVAGGDSASALAAGCPIVVKAHPAHPGVSEMIGQAIVAAARETGLPEGVFSLLFDAGHEVGVALVNHPMIKAVAFTGSLRAGRALYDLAARRAEPIPVYAEMGSVNPVFLLPGALAARREQIAEGLFQSITMGGGQLCTKPGLVFVPEGDAVQEPLVKLVSGATPCCMLHRGILSSYHEGLRRLAAHPAVQMIAPSPMAPPEGRAAVALLTTDTTSLIADPCLADEVFGPATLLVSYASMDELVEFAHQMPGQLAAAIHGDERDLIAASPLVSALETRVGRLVFNQFPTGVDVGQAMVHGGPYPATTDSRTTSVGAAAILRFARPVCYQNFPDAALPPALRADNPLNIRRSVEGRPE